MKGEERKWNCRKERRGRREREILHYFLLIVIRYI